MQTIKDKLNKLIEIDSKIMSKSEIKELEESIRFIQDEIIRNKYSKADFLEECSRLDVDTNALEPYLKEFQYVCPLTEIVQL